MNSTIETLDQQSISEMIISEILNPLSLITGEFDLMGVEIGNGGKRIEFEFTVACETVSASVEVYNNFDGFSFYDLQLFLCDDDSTEVNFSLEQQKEILNRIIK